MAGATGLRYNFSKPSSNDSPLFERQIGDEYAELQHCRMIIEQQQQRINRLEIINVDLERRLEDQARQSMDVEAECIAIERRWKERGEQYQREIERVKKDHDLEKRRSAQLREQLSRTERELYVILQRSYELRRGPAVSGSKGAPGGNDNTISSKLSASSDMQHSSGAALKRVDTAGSDLDLYHIAKVSCRLIFKILPSLHLLALYFACSLQSLEGHAKRRFLLTFQIFLDSNKYYSSLVSPTLYIL